MRPTGGVDGSAVDTEYTYPGIHLDVDPQSFCSEAAADLDAVRSFLDSLTYAKDR
jgi:hypothetical protein